MLLIGPIKKGSPGEVPRRAALDSGSDGDSGGGGSTLDRGILGTRVGSDGCGIGRPIVRP